jgi:hypothetical protein
MTIITLNHGSSQIHHAFDVGWGIRNGGDGGVSLDLLYLQQFNTIFLLAQRKGQKLADGYKAFRLFSDCKFFHDFVLLMRPAA